ncbi:MAG TPA: BTAD domain-containing putative transcriptional regulator [Candidatus Acidoferrales bacterium]|nr:BTAD domain-containing putative transcriptional regulator [Candidatus Acidoferrales bacterium]
MRRGQLVERVRQAQPRLITVAASAGWGKTHFGKELCSGASLPLMVSFKGVTDVDEAEVRLGYRRGEPSWRQSPCDVAILDDADALESAGATPLLSHLSLELPPSRTLVVMSPFGLKFEFARYFAPHEIVALRRDELAITHDEAREIIAESYMPTEVLEHAVRETYGWPILTFLFARLAREGKLEEALADRASRVLDPLHQYVQTRLMSMIPEKEVAVIVAFGALNGADADEISAAVGFDAQPTIDDIMRKRYQLLVAEDGSFRLLPGPEGNIRALYPQQVRAMRERVARSLFERGKYVRAAGFAIGAGDYEFSARCLDAAGRRAAGEPVTAEYQAVAEKLPLEYVLKSKNVFLEYFSNRRTRSQPYDVHERVRKFCDGLTPDVDPFVRYSARVALTATLRMTHRGREAEAQAGECALLADAFPDAPDRHALLRSESAIIASFRGRLNDAEKLWENFDTTESIGTPWFAFAHFETMAPIALQRGDQLTVARSARANIEAARLWNDPACLAQALAGHVVANATLAPESTVRSIVAQIETTIYAIRSSSLARSFEERFTQPYKAQSPTPTLVSCLLSIHAAFAQNDREIAQRLVRESIAGFDLIGFPYWQIAARLAATRIDGFDREELLEECVALGGQMQAPELQEQVRALAEGRRADGPYSTFLDVLDRAPLLARAAVFRVRLLDGKVTRGGVNVPVRQREFELLANLALANGSIAAETLCESMWPDSDEEAAVSALRMGVYRLRKQLEKSSVVSVHGGYHLGPEIAVDILELETSFTALRRLPALNDDDRTSLHALFQYMCEAHGAPKQSESWYGKIERRMEDLRHGAGVLLAKEYLRIGEPLRALEAGEALLRVDEVDEKAVALCVEALTASGDKSAAMRLWQQYVKRLATLYGAEPSISIDDLVAR